MSERNINITIRRPFTLTDWEEHGPVAGSVLPVGTVLTVIVTEGTLQADIDIDFPNQVGGVESPAALLRATTEVPCEHLSTGSCDCNGDYPCSHSDWFICRRYDDENIPVCLGDKARCPFKESEEKTA